MTTTPPSSAPRSVAPRVVRGTSAGTAATLFALAFHLLADGAAPSPLAILAPLGASVLVGVLLAGHRLSLGRLALTVTAAQVLFHVLFVLGAPSAPRTPHAPHAGGPHAAPAAPLTHPMPAGHTGHVDPVASVAPVVGMADATHTAHAGHAHGDVAMIAAHLAAALLTLVLLHRGERALERVRAWADARLSRWADLLTGAVAVAPEGRTAGRARDLAPLPFGFRPGVCPAAAPRRGPPPGTPRTPMTAVPARSRAPPDES
ncbi:hypothetical protein [Serinibacter arcticus]|nr:hypothetical protein [Serinibacter arcticus]